MTLSLEVPMTELFDTSSVHDDSAAWDTRTRWVMDTVRRRHSGIGALGELHAAWIAAGLAVAASMFLTFNSSPALPRARSGEWFAVVIPSDVGARALVLPDHPPALGALILADAPDGGTR